MNPTAELLEEAVSGLGDGREERQQGQELPEEPHQQKGGCGTEILEHGPLVIICGSYVACTTTWCHGRSGECGSPQGQVPSSV